MRKISVLLSEREEARFCAYCKKTGHKKSTLIAHLIKEHLDKESHAIQASVSGTPSVSPPSQPLLDVADAETAEPIHPDHATIEKASPVEGGPKS